MGIDLHLIDNLELGRIFSRFLLTRIHINRIVYIYLLLWRSSMRHKVSFFKRGFSFSEIRDFLFFDRWSIPLPKRSVYPAIYPSVRMIKISQLSISYPSEQWSLHCRKSKSENLSFHIIMWVMQTKSSSSSCRTASTDIPPYHPMLPAGLQGCIPYRHRVAVCRFWLVVLSLPVHVKGSTGLHHL